MKRFFRSVGGKLTLFICCVLCLGLLASSALLAAFLVSEREFYTASSEAEVREVILSRSLRGYGFSLLADIQHRYLPEADWGNAVWQVQDESGEVLCRSRSAGTVESWEFRFDYSYDPATGAVSSAPPAEREGLVYYAVSFALKEGLPAADELALNARLVHLGWLFRYAVYLVGLLALGLSVVSFVGLMCVSARRPATEELHPGPLYRVPFDLMLAVCAAGFVFLCLAADDAAASDAGLLAAACLLGFLGVNLLLGLSMSAAGRIKGQTLLKNTLIARVLRLIRHVLRWLWGLLRAFPLIWKTALALLLICVLELGFLVGADEPFIRAAFWLPEKLILVPAALWLAVNLRKLQKGGEALAAGELSYHTDTRGMLWDLRRHGENLNSIAGGMSAAVEQRMKSERMKTELITNVSHDLKTPLTSVISYAELLGREVPPEGKPAEYARVLLRQSERLKRLIDDLVEASKAATGNLEVELAPCDAAVFLSQAAGEYEERLQAAGLSLVLRQPEEELRILADGRRMQRIFDNLLGNILKYALPGTRVFLSLERVGERAVFIFRNTSRAPLERSEEELMERFTRGDSARSTEGSGLGLSIARSMAELQGGSLGLTLDGDLFKTILSFPLVLTRGSERECSQIP